VKPDHSILYLLLAKAGHKIEGDKEAQGSDLWEHFYDEEIETYTMDRLSTFQDILSKDSNVEDIYMLHETRKYSMDYDYKRKIIDDGFTVPHQTMQEMTLHRGVVNTLRMKKNIRATPELVSFYQKRAKSNIRMRTSNIQDCKRHFLRALTQEVKPFQSFGSYGQLLTDLRDFNVTMDKLKNAKRTPFVANVVFNNGLNRKYIRLMLAALGYESDNNYKEWIDLLIHKGLSNPVTMFD